jgi:Protein of unknown function (DUF1488)
MPLKRSRDKILVTIDGVEFLMADQSTEVPCRAESGRLCDRFGSSGDSHGNEKAFRLNREDIERAASSKYDAGKIEPRAPWKIIVSATDIASPLSQKM